MQNYKNHTQKDRGWMIAFLILLGMTVMTVWGLSMGYMQAQILPSIDQLLLNALITLLPLLLLRIVLFKLRGYATTLQDRIIRQEVNFRHYLVTGKELNPALTIKQIVALRFAGDAEFVALCERAVAEKLSNKQIKQAIVDWKGDYVRV